MTEQNKQDDYILSEEQLKELIANKAKRAEKLQQQLMLLSKTIFANE